MTTVLMKQRNTIATISLIYNQLENQDFNYSHFTRTTNSSITNTLHQRMPEHFMMQQTKFHSGDDHKHHGVSYTLLCLDIPSWLATPRWGDCMSNLVCTTWYRDAKGFKNSQQLALTKWWLDTIWSSYQIASSKHAHKQSSVKEAG